MLTLPVYSTIAEALIVSTSLIVVLAVWWYFSQDMYLARASAARGSLITFTRCGPIEYQKSGAGVPLLMIHGSRGGHDQGMAFAGGLARQGIRVVAKA